MTVVARRIQRPLVHAALPNKTKQNFLATQTEKFAKKFGSTDLWFGSAISPNLEPNFGPVLKSSGSNFGSEPNCGIPN
jgi:hypothetical protein